MAQSIEDLYQQYAGRAADPEGAAFWTQAFGDTIDADEIAAFQRSVAEVRAQGTEPTAEVGTTTAADTTTGAVNGALALANSLDMNYGAAVPLAWSAPVLQAVQAVGGDEYSSPTYFNPNDGKTYNSQAEADAANAAIVNDSKKTALTKAWEDAQGSNDYTGLADTLANTNTTGYDLYTMFGMTPTQQAAIAQQTGYDLTPDVITDYRGKTYDTGTVLNLANQLAGIADTSAFSGGVYGVTKGSVGFDYDQAARVLGRDLTTGEQVLLDSARSLIDQGITDLSKLGMGDIKTSVTVQEERDENGNATGNYVAYVPTGTDWEGGTTFTTRVVTPEEATRIRSVENAASGESDAYTTRFLDDVVTGRGIVYDGKNLAEGTSLGAGSTYTGKGGTTYQITYDDQGQPRFTTTGFSTNALSQIAPLLQVASFIPGVAPFAMAANAAIAASQGNVFGALASLAGMGGYTNLATGLNVANAVDKKDVGALAGALLSNPTIAGTAASTMLTDTVSLADLGNAANLAINVDNGNWAGALSSVGSLTGNSDIRVAASAATIITELGKDNPNIGAILNATQTITNATSGAAQNVNAETVSGITNRVVDDLTASSGGTDLATSAYVAAINAGATETEALAAANSVSDSTTTSTGGDARVVVNKVDDAGPSNAVTTTYGDGGVDTNFGDLDSAVSTQARNTEVERLVTEFEKQTGKTFDKVSENEAIGLGIAMRGLSNEQLQQMSIQDIIGRTPAIVGKDDQGRWLDDKGYAYDDKGFKYAPGSDRPIIEITGVGSRGEAEGPGIAANLADSIVENITGLDGTTGKIVQQGLATILGGLGEQVADLSTSLGNMGIVGRDNAGVKVGTYLEDIGNRLQLPETKLAIDNWVNAVDKEPTYYGKIAAGVKGVFQNPLVLTEVVKEIGQEVLPGALALKVAKYAGVAAGAASSTLLNSLESAGSTGRQAYEEEIAKGTPPAQAARIADRAAGYAGLITMATSGITDAAIAKKYGAAIEDYLGRKASSTGGEFAQESFEEGLIALATGKTPAEAMTQSVVGGLVGAKTSGTVQTAADVQADFAASFAAQGLTSTDGSFRAETIVPLDTTTGNVAAGAGNIGAVDTTLGATNIGAVDTTLGATNIGAVDTTAGAGNIGAVDTTAGAGNIGAVDTTFGTTNIGSVGTTAGAENLGAANIGATDTTALGGANLTQTLQSGDAGAIDSAVTGSIKTSLDSGASVETAVGGAINTVLTGGGNVESAVTNSVTAAVESSVGTVLTGGGNVESAVTNSVTAAVESSVGTVLTGGGNVESAVTNSVTAAVESSVGTVLTGGGNVDSAVTNSVTAAVESSVGTVVTNGGNVESAVTNSVTAAVESSVGAVVAGGGNVESAVTNSVTAAVESSVGAVVAGGGNVESAVTNSVTAAVESSVGAVLTNGGNVDSAVTNSVTAAVAATVTAGGNVDAAVGSSIGAAVTAGGDVNIAVDAAVNAATNAGNDLTVVSDADVTTITNATTGSTITVDNNTGATTVVNPDADLNTDLNTDLRTDPKTVPKVEVDGPVGTDTTVIDADTVDLGDGVVIDISTGEALTPAEVEERKKKAQLNLSKTAKKPSGMLVGASGATPPYKPSDISETWLGGQFRNLAPLVAFAGLLPENNPMFQDQQALSALRRASGLGGEPERPQADYFSYGSEPSVTSVLAPYKRGGGVQDPTGGGKIMTSPLQAASGGDVEHKGSHYVQGAGGGQDDLIPAKLADGEYVFDAEIVAALGDGSNKEGARKLDEFREAIRQHKRSGSIKTIPPKAKSPLAYMKGIK